MRSQRFTDGIDTHENKGASAQIRVYLLTSRIGLRWCWTKCTKVLLQVCDVGGRINASSNPLV
ncbi:unnamed protein product [Dicrocoelium dendriticum]|nr:unnamed protein product [Dicrocoelium dendriticum]